MAYLDYFLTVSSAVGVDGASVRPISLLLLLYRYLCSRYLHVPSGLSFTFIWQVERTMQNASKALLA
jgi:hypothetical protein